MTTRREFVIGLAAVPAAGLSSPEHRPDRISQTSALYSPYRETWIITAEELTEFWYERRFRCLGGEYLDVIAWRDGTTRQQLLSRIRSKFRHPVSSFRVVDEHDCVYFTIKEWKDSPG